MTSFKDILQRVNAAAPDFTFRRPASAKSVAAFQKEIGFKLPHEYTDFLSVSNGCCGIILNMYFELYDVEYCLDRARDVDLEWPKEQKLVVIGTDGGGQALVYNYSKEQKLFEMGLGNKGPVLVECKRKGGETPNVCSRAWIQSSDDPVILEADSLSDLFEKCLRGWPPY